MSQPKAIIAKIKITGDAYKKYMHKIAPQLTVLVQNAVTATDAELIYWKYNKKNEFLYAFFFFNHADSMWLETSPHLDMLRQIQGYIDPESTGYLLLTLDANSPWQPHAAFTYHTLEKGRFAPCDIDTLTSRQIKKDANPFFKVTEGIEDMDDLLSRQPKVLDPAILRQYEKQKEQHRITYVKANLHLATTDNPLELFNGWKYDGTTLISRTGKKYPQLNPQHFRETPYGYCDDRYIIVYTNYLSNSTEHILETNPNEFKILRKGESTKYYLSEHTVYDDQLQPMLYADCSTFKLLGEYHARDKNNLYTFGGGTTPTIIPLAELGEPYWFEPEALNRWDRLIIGQNQIHVGRFHIDGIDVPTFQRLPYNLPEHILQIFRWSHIYLQNEFILHGCDKEGLFFLIISIQSSDEHYRNLIPHIPELPVNIPLLMRCGIDEFEKWYFDARTKFRKEAERLYAVRYGTD